MSFGLHRVEPGVVVRELVEVGPCDLPVMDGSSPVTLVRSSSVPCSISISSPTPELLKNESVIPKVESDVVGNGQSLDGRECGFLTHS